MKQYLAEGLEAFVIAQIESDAGVQNSQAIAADRNVDALFVGPADLCLARCDRGRS